MATRFTKEESILALAFLAAHSDGITDTETGFINKKLMPFYGLDKKVDTNNFLDKWATLIEGGNSDVEQACINTLKKCNYDIRVKACAAIWEVSYVSDENWSDKEGELFFRVLEALDVKKDDAKAEWKKIE